MKPIYRCKVCGAYTEDPIHCGRPAELILDPRRRTALSKLMSGLLRHFPWEAGLRLDEEGWVSIDELVRGIREKWRNRHLYTWLRREHVEAVAALDPKHRFGGRDGRRRARYGHSVRVKIKYMEETHPPPKLYHGTSRDRLASILAKGILPMKRLYVHLTASPEDARINAMRHGAPVVLVIDTLCLMLRNIRILRATDKIYLVSYVPKECIEKALS